MSQGCHCKGLQWRVSVQGEGHKGHYPKQALNPSLALPVLSTLTSVTMQNCSLERCQVIPTVWGLYWPLLKHTRKWNSWPFSLLSHLPWCFNPENPSFSADLQALGPLVSSWAWQTVTEVFTQTQYYACNKQTQTTEVVGGNKMLTCSICDKNELFVFKENQQYLEETECYSVFWRLWSSARFS